MRSFCPRMSSLKPRNKPPVSARMIGAQAVAAELLDQRLGQLVKRVGDDHDLAHGSEAREKVASSQVGLDPVRDRLEVAQRDSPRARGRHPPVHQLVEIADVPGGEGQFGQVEVRAQDGPDSGREPLEVEGEDMGASLTHINVGWPRRR